MRLALLWLPLVGCSVWPSAQAASSAHAERVAAAQVSYEHEQQRLSSGLATVDDVCAWSVRWHTAQKEAGDGAASTAHLARMEALASKVSADVAAGMATPRDADAVRYFLAEARVWAGK